MSDLDLDLARAAVALPGWQWQPGMRTDSKFAHVVAVDSDTGAPCAAEEGASEDDCYAVWLDYSGVLPDYRHPGTAGCLLAMLGPGWMACLGPDWAWVERNPHGAAGDTLGEACIRAAMARGWWGVR